MTNPDANDAGGGDGDYHEIATRGVGVIVDLGKATDPADLLSLIDQVAMEDRRDALFAAVLFDMHRGAFNKPQPPAFAELYKRWTNQILGRPAPIGDGPRLSD